MRQIRHSEIDMTQGSVVAQLIAFSIPLLLGEVFQQLYNTADTLIVGRFVSKQALAAVSATSNIVNILIGLFAGISTGATVDISNRFVRRMIPGSSAACRQRFGLRPRSASHLLPSASCSPL